MRLGVCSLKKSCSGRPEVQLFCGIVRNAGSAGSAKMYGGIPVFNMQSLRTGKKPRYI